MFFLCNSVGCTALRLSVLQLLSSGSGLLLLAGGLGCRCRVLSNCFVMNEKKQTETKHGNNEVIFFRRLLCGNEC